MLYYQNEIKLYVPNSDSIVSIKSCAILRAYLEKAVIGGAWPLTFRLVPEGETPENFVMAPRVYTGYDGKKGLLELMGIEFPEGLEKMALGITRLQDLEVKKINRVMQRNGSRALYYIPNSEENST